MDAERHAAIKVFVHAPSFKLYSRSVILKFHVTVFHMASSWHTREDVRNKSACLATFPSSLPRAYLAIISSRLDYCNSLLCGIAGNLLQKLQSVQNATARLIMRTGRRQHITPCSSAGAALVTSSTACWFQDGCSWVQGVTRPASTVAGWRLSALDWHWPPITAICWCLDVCHKENTYASRRQEFFRRWTISLELSACRITWQRHLTCTL